MTTLTVPELSLVVLVGVTGSGKSTFARKHFKPTEILSSDACRGLVSDDENNQAATGDAFAVLHVIARKRLARGLLTVVDATNVQVEARKPLVALAREFHALPVAIVLDVDESVCRERNKTRADRTFGPHVVRQQMQQLRASLRKLEREGFRHVFVLDSLEDIEAATIERQPLWNNKKDDHGPFDVVGDVHGCFDELMTLLRELGYVVRRTDGAEHAFAVPPKANRLRPSRHPSKSHVLPSSLHDPAPLPNHTSNYPTPQNYITHLPILPSPPRLLHVSHFILLSSFFPRTCRPIAQKSPLPSIPSFNTNHKPSLLPAKVSAPSSTRPTEC